MKKVGRGTTRRPTAANSRTGLRPIRSDSRPYRGWRKIIVSEIRADAVSAVTLLTPAVLRQVGRQVGVEHVVGHRVEHDQSEEAEQPFALPCHGLPDRALGHRSALGHFDEDRALLHPSAQIQAGQPERQRDQEQHPPPPRVHLGLTDELGEQGGQAQCGEGGHVGREVEQTEHHASLPLAHVLVEQGRGAEFSSCGEALHHAHHQEQQRSDKAHGGVGRQQADGGGGARHQQDDREQGVAAADPVATAAEVHAAQRADQERQREDPVGGQQPSGVAFLREEVMSDRGCHDTVDRVVEPFDRDPDRGGPEHPSLSSP